MSSSRHDSPFPRASADGEQSAVKFLQHEQVYKICVLTSF